MFARKVLLKKLSISLSVLFALFLTQSLCVRDEGPDTSMYDFVAMGFLEDYVDLMEMVTWFGRRVRDNIDEGVESAFELLAKQQDPLQPYLEKATQLNRTDCTDDKLMTISDIVFKEYFNVNMNCQRVQQKMAVFFNEMHNITARLTDIHRRYINAAGGCGPPYFPGPQIDRECLQKLVQGGKAEVDGLRQHVFALSSDVEEFMDSQVEETRFCLLRSMSHVRNATKRAAHSIQCCLADDHGEFEEHSFRFPSEHPYLELPVEKNPFEGLDFSREEKEAPAAETAATGALTHPPVVIPEHPGAFQAPHPVQNPTAYPPDHNEKHPGGVPPPGEQRPEQPPWRTNTRQHKDFMNRRMAGGGLSDFDFSGDMEGFEPQQDGSGSVVGMYDEMNKFADDLEKFYGLKDEREDKSNKS